MIDDLAKVEKRVIPAKVGIHKALKLLDSRLRGNDSKKRYWLFTKPIFQLSNNGKYAYLFVIYGFYEPSW